MLQRQQNLESQRTRRTAATIAEGIARRSLRSLRDLCVLEVFAYTFHSPNAGRRPKPRPELARDLGVSHAGAIVVGTIIGSGIFLVPAEMMQAVGSAKLVYLAWLVGGLLSFFGALTYAELGAMKPQAGGEYVYVRDGYGPLAGFLYAWTWFLIAKPASIATSRPDWFASWELFRSLHSSPTPQSASPSSSLTDNSSPSPPRF